MGQNIANWVLFAYGKYSRFLEGEQRMQEPISWRFSVGINLVLIVALLLLLLVLPESPRYAMLTLHSAVEDANMMQMAGRQRP